MCQHPAPHGSRADALHHGARHDDDHARWTRRDFLVRAGLGTAAASVTLGSTSVQALTRSPFLDALGRAETDRVLVLVQLSGGNDGLNTVVPIRNDLYYAARPTLGIAPASTLPLDDDHGFHTALSPLQPMWGDGQMAIVQNVGYPAPSLSHFRSTDIWLSGSDGDEVVGTGWAGRSLAVEYPQALTTPPEAPPAVQIGTSAPLLFQGEDGGYGMALLQIDQFLRVAAGGDPYPTSGLPQTPAGDELAFLRTVANDAFRYREALQSATQQPAAVNTVEYPETRVGESLSAVAKLIKGRLGARIYLVSIGGFDTHAQQADVHAALLDDLAQSLAALYTDLAASGDDTRTLAMTFSEFGRRIHENGSDGTDHGTAAPVFLFGPAASGGLYGDEPDLATLDADGNLIHTTDFREVYASVLRSWFEMTDAEAGLALGGTYATLPIVDAGAPVASTPAPGERLSLAPPAPNPARTHTRIRFVLHTPMPVAVEVYDRLGRRVATLADGMHAAGAHTASLDVSGLAAGTYTVRLRTPEDVRSRTMTVVR